MLTMMKMKTSKTPAPAPTQLAALLARKQEIATRRREVVDRIVWLERRGVTTASTAGRAVREQAQALLNGAIANLLPASEPKTDDLGALRAELAIIDDALAMSAPIEMQLRGEETKARIAARADDIQKVMRGIAEAVIGLERALQARDQLVKEIRPGDQLVSGQGWVLAGRLGNSGTQAYRFLQDAANNGWITRGQFEEELSRARKVNP